MDDRKYDRWQKVYLAGGEGPYPWDLGRPRDFLVELVEQGVIRGKKVLDTCCGLGTNGLYLAEKGYEVTGIDISGKALELAEKKARGRSLAGSIRFERRNFMGAGFGPGSFEFILDIGCFHHVAVEDRDTFIANIHRTLGPGGRYLLMCFSDRMGGAWNHFSPDQLKGLFSERFETLESREIASVEGDGVTRFFHVVLMERIMPSYGSG